MIIAVHINFVPLLSGFPSTRTADTSDWLDSSSVIPEDSKILIRAGLSNPSEENFIPVIDQEISVFAILLHVNIALLFTAIVRLFGTSTSNSVMKTKYVNTLYYRTHFFYIDLPVVPTTALKFNNNNTAKLQCSFCKHICHLLSPMIKKTSQIKMEFQTQSTTSTASSCLFFKPTTQHVYHIKLQCFYDWDNHIHEFN